MNEQTQFKIDTSGLVFVPRPGAPQYPDAWGFDHLSPFQQGAEGEARRELFEKLDRHGERFADVAAAQCFSRWHPSALQRIMADCGRYEALQMTGVIRIMDGGLWWAARQAGALVDLGFPPLTISLAEDGLIHLSEVAS